MLNRREFLARGAAGAAGALSLAGAARFGGSSGPFSRRYAPHLGMFPHHAGSDPIDEIKFLAGEGFTALEDGGLKAKPARLQAHIGEEAVRRGITIGLFVGLADFGRPTFASGTPHARQAVLGELKKAIETARRVGGRYLVVVPGQTARLPAAVETRHAVDLLGRCCDLCDRRDVVLLLEPIHHGADSSRLFLRSAEQAAGLCRAVGRPSCRLLFDVYQQALAGQDAPRLLRETGDVLGYVQLADAPGRTEPGSGHIDFSQMFAALDAIGYDGVLGMEHGSRRPGKEGERAVIDAYRTLERRA